MADKQDPDPKAKSEPEPEQGDVLVYLARMGALRCCWNVTKRPGFGGITPGSHTIPPGLSFVPAAIWPQVKDSATWDQHSQVEAEGRAVVRAVAGVERPLLKDWHAISAKDAIAWVAKTGLLETLERLHTMESMRRPSRPELAQAIDVQLRRVHELAAAQ